MTHVTNGDSSLNIVNIADNSCSTDVQLTKLSKLLVELDDTRVACSGSLSQPHPTCAEAVNIVKLTLGSSDDRYVIYTAQKVLVSLLKHNPCQEGLDLIQQMFRGDQQWQTIQTGLQICRQLLSKQSCHRYLVFYKLNSSICAVWKRLTNIVTSNAVSMETNQCLYECCSIFIKVIKMFDSESKEVFEIFFKQILLNGFLCDILFHDHVKSYVVSKVIQLLCSFIQLGAEKQEVFLEEKILASSAVFKILCSRDPRHTYVVTGNQTFVGIQYKDGSEKQSECTNINIAHLRDWTYLMFTVASRLIHKQDYVAMVTKYLSEVDTYLQEVLNMTSSLPFPWLPKVFSEQDDVWINVLLLVLHIYPVDSGILHTSESSTYRQQHHMHFLKFIGTLGYDHLVLIDLLTSPETKCLSYITKYLKLLYSSWNEFIHVTELLTDPDEDTDFLSDPEEDMKLFAGNDKETKFLHGTDKETKLLARIDKETKLLDGTAQNQELFTGEDTGSDKENEKSIESILDEVQTSISETMCKMAIDSSDNTMPTSDNFSCLSTKSSNCDNVRTSKGERQGTVSAGGGLALIAGAYDDDSDSDLDDNLGDNGLTNDNVNSDIGDCKVENIGKSCSVENRIFECYDTESGEKSETCANSKDENKVNTPSTVSYAVSDFVEDAADDIDDEFEEDDFDPDKYKNVLKDLNEDIADCVYTENELLDNAMSMLIRTRLKLEKLRDSDLISYNPNVLIQLISCVEGFYEGNESND